MQGSSGGQSGGAGSEVLPLPASTPQHLSELIDEQAGAGALTEAPPGGSADRLVDGFPTEVIAIPEDFTVRTSEVSTDSGRAQVTLTAGTARACAGVLVDYRGWFTRGGFTESATHERPAGARVAFDRDHDRVTVTTTPDGDGCAIALLAALEVGRR
ncbi:MAG: hypothetical protein QM708_11430 [Propioniciclava sp.]|uniref:hypothetical protein n=1 Tax=Propioniciclava sp. TaxID=2038686 RepID=UPI0039E4E49B